jgi:hypothetical protein
VNCKSLTPLEHERLRQRNPHSIASKVALICSGNVVRAVAVSIALSFGCRRPQEVIVSPSSTAFRHEACNTADSPVICREVQKCFQSNTSTVVCRDLEDDAIQISRMPTQPAGNGAANALKY